MRCGPADRAFWRYHQTNRAGIEARTQDQGAVTSEGGINEILGEPLRLRLGANENCHAENHARETQDECTLAMPEEAQRNMKSGRHRWSNRGAIFVTRCRTSLPGRS